MKLLLATHESRDMTEDQLRHMFEQLYGPRPKEFFAVREVEDCHIWDWRLEGFLACAKVLEPLITEANQIKKAAYRMVEAFEVHANKCRPCTVEWQNLKATLQGKKNAID